jgi:hypothetical protein
VTTPDAERGPRTGPRPDQATPRRSDLDTDRTPALARLTWNGHPRLLPTYWRTDLRTAGRHPDVLALVIFEAIGPKRSRAVAYELLGLSQEVV